MSGDGTFAGTNYQAGVIAYVFAHVLAETKLRWFSTADDTPSAVSGEVRLSRRALIDIRAERSTPHPRNQRLLAAIVQQLAAKRHPRPGALR